MRKGAGDSYTTRAAAPPELVRTGPGGAPTAELLRDTAGETTLPDDELGRLLLRGRPLGRCERVSSCETCRRCRVQTPPCQIVVSAGIAKESACSLRIA